MAKVLLASVAFHCPEAELYLCLADKRLPDTGQYPANVGIVAADELAIPDFCSFAFRYTIMEFNTALKPFMIRHLLGQAIDTVLYLDPDIEVFAPLDMLLEPLRAGYSFVLTPHICQPAEGDTFPDDMGIMRAGIYNLGFLGVAVGKDTERLLRWWCRRLRYDCVSEQERGVFVDQKFIDLLPGFTDSVRIVRDTVCNVAYWNLQQRNLTQASDHWLIDGEQLRFFHFSGINIDDLTYLSKWTQEFRGAEISSALHALMQHYADQVRAAGYVTGGQQPPYAYGCFRSGTPIPDPVRRMFRDRHLSWLGDPFETYEEYLHLPIAEQWAGSSSCMITNLMDDLRQRDPWLRSRFNPARPEDVEAYVRWFVEYGPSLIKEPRLIQRVADRLEGRQRH
jgi:hypothetical protein